MYDIKEIKSRVSCVDYAKQIGLPISKSGDRCASPFHNGTNKTSLIVKDDYWHSYSDGFGGDVIDFCAIYAHNGNKGPAIRELAEIAGVKNDNEPNGDWLEYTNQMNARTAFYHAALTPADREYLHQRGLSDEAIDRLMIGRVTDGHLKGRLHLPYFKNGYCCYSATRALPGGNSPDSKYMKQKRDGFCQHVPWGLQTLNRRTDILIISEGYFDAVSWECEGYAVLSPITGNFSSEQWPAVLSACRLFSKVLIIFDNDDVSHAGDTFTARTAQRLFQARIPFMVATTPQGVKDVNDYYAGGGSLERLVEKAQDGLKYMVSLYDDATELKKFILSINRYTDITTITSALMSVDNFEKPVIKSILEDAKKPPTETMIVEDIAKKHNLIFVENDGFYEWSGQIWKKISDYTVERYAGEEYGTTFRTAQRMAQVRKHLYSEKLANVEFNKRNLMNFPNGTLELDTGIFREHRETDYCSFFQSYAYDPAARCPRWEKFIEECTDDDPKRMEALQTIMGYVMLADCRYQLMFLLMGKGGNGKSVYLDVMKELFGAENCTTVDPEQMNDNFQRILLRDSLVNYASEISGDMSATVKWVKSIACGEQINGCYKGKDNINFTPRCKMIFSCNSSPKANVIEGLDRRLFFVDFPCKFVDFPDPSDPTQRQADRDIIPKLLQELPGIFNWAYQGYQLLNIVKYFTETDEQAYYMQRFRESTNPIIVFCDEYAEFFTGMVPKRDLYNMYKTWCSENGHKAMASTNFFASFFSNMENKIENRSYRPWTGETSRPRYVVFK